MLLQLTILAETVQVREGREFVTVTGIEQGTAPMLQMVDYTLKADEAAQHKGKLVGKGVSLHVESVRALFSGRPQLNGRLVSANSGK